VPNLGSQKTYQREYVAPGEGLGPHPLAVPIVLPLLRQLRTARELRARLVRFGLVLKEGNSP
jgi:hypothetical protein